MRILQAIALFPPDLAGGAARVCRRLSEELARRGHTLDVLSGRATADEPVGAVARGRLGAIGTWRVNVGPALDPWSEQGYENEAATDAFAEALAALRPDVAHLHSLQGLGVGPIHAAAAAGVPVVLTMHDWWWLCPCLFRLSPRGEICPPGEPPERCSGRDLDFGRRRAVLERALERVDRVLVPSAFLRDSLASFGIAAGRIEVQENGVEPPLSRPAPPAGTAGPPTLVYVGGAGNREKGLPVLLEAVARLGSLDFRLLCHSVAEEEVAPWRERIGARLECRPPFPPEDLDRVMAEADLVVVPSLMRESFSLVTREALARARPVVASDCGGPGEVLRDGENGRIVASGSPEALARALAELVGDPDARRRLLPWPPPRFPTPGDHARATERLYRSALAARRPARASGSRRSLVGREVLFLVGIDGAPLRYRVWHLTERLEAAGVRCRVLYHSDLRAPAAAERADLLVLYRAPLSAAAAAAVAAMRRRGRPVVFSVDDLVFRADLAADAPALEGGDPARAAGFRESVEAYERSARAADAFLASTPEIAEAAGDLGVPVFVEPNRLGAPFLGLAEEARRARAPAGQTIGYLSGTDTHDQDLASIARPLARALARFPSARLLLVGPIRLPPELEALGARVERAPFVPWSALPSLLASLDVSLLPLDLSRRFNAAKSAIKYLEAAALGVATIASPSPDVRRVTGDGRTALLAADEGGWEDALSRLLACPAAGRELGERARRDAIARHGPESAIDELRGWLEDLLAAGVRPGRPSPEPVVCEAGSGSAVALEPPRARYDAWQLEAEAGSPLGPGREVEQEIECARDGLCRIDVRVGTYARRNRHRLVLSVRDEAGRELARRSLATELLVDRSFVSLEIDPPADRSAGRRFRIRAEAPEARPGDEVLLWQAPSERGGLTIGAERSPGRELCYRTFVVPTPGGRA